MHRLGRKYFNPRTPYGVRRGMWATSQKRTSFQSTHPVWGATFDSVVSAGRGRNISIHAPRMGCDAYTLRASTLLCRISIHAPRMGCDHQRRRFANDSQISIHAPRMGCDTTYGKKTTSEHEFQSTHPVWGATNGKSTFIDTISISIHAPRMGCDLHQCAFRDNKQISIHAPRMGCDFFIADTELLQG